MNWRNEVADRGSVSVLNKNEPMNRRHLLKSAAIGAGVSSFPWKSFAQGDGELFIERIPVFQK